jgi:hypothetical protein
MQFCIVSYLLNITRQLQGSKMGGMITLSVIRKDDVESIPEPVDGGIYGAIVLKPGASFVTWQTRYQSAGISSRSRLSKEGSSKDTELGFIISLDRLAIKNMLLAAEEDEFIVIYRYATGPTKIFGLLEAPARFTFDHSSGKQPTDGNENNCRFYYAGPDNTYFFFGEIPAPAPGAAPAVVRYNGEVIAVLQPGETLDIQSDFGFTDFYTTP